MRFALRNAPATSQSALDTIQSGAWWKTCLNYIDGVIILYKNNLQRVNDIEEVLKLLHQDAVTLEQPNYHFYQNKIECLGHELMLARFAAANINVDAIKTAFFTTDSAHIRSC